MKHIDDYAVRDDLPESLNRPNAKELAELWDKSQLKFIDSQIHNILIYPAIDQLPSELVDELAVQLHCDFYDKSLSLEARRQIVKTSIAWHRIKGTPAAVEMLTQVIFKKSFVKEWFDYNGSPYYFRMVQDISDGAEDVTRETLAQLKKAIWMGKNVRSWLEMIEFHVNIEEIVEHSEKIAELSAQLKFQDWMPYGHRLWVPERDGSLCRGGVVYRDGSFFHDGSLLHNGMTPGEWPYHHGWDELSMDDLFVAARLAFFDDVSEGGLFRDGSIVRNGEYFHGGTDTLPADLGIYGLHFHHHFIDTVPAIGEIGIGRLNLGFADIMPYGHRYIVQHDGEAERGGVAYRDGGFIRDNDISHDSITPGRIWERGGRRDLAMDETFAAAHFSFFDDVSESDIMRDGRICHDGRFPRGPTWLPYDEKLPISFSMHVEDEAQTEDENGKLSVECNICRQGDFRHDGSMERGGYSFDDDLDGCLSLIAMERSGKYCRDGAMERAVDGRLIAG